MSQIIQRRNEIINPPPLEVRYHYSVWQPKYDEIKNIDNTIQFVKGLPTELENELIIN